MKNLHKLFLFIATIFLFASCAEPVTIETLLHEMTDRDALSQKSPASFTAAQFSSYDRRSKTPGNDDWFANDDNNTYMRTEQRGDRKERVMMDTTGPGAIVRFWMTFAGDLKVSGQGKLRIYIDNQETPAYECSAFDFFRKGLAGAPLVASVSELTPFEQRGHNCYFPIPYAKRCKITYEPVPGECVYYNIGFRTYTSPVEIESFSADLLDKYAAVIEKTQEELSGKNRATTFPNQTTFSPGEIAAEQQETIFTNDNANSAIRKIEIKLPELSQKEMANLLRKTVMEISFDGETTVWVPLGDFFGTGYQLRNLKTRYTQADATSRTLSCEWVMPYKEECKIDFLNLSDKAMQMPQVTIAWAPYSWNGNSMHFGSAWHQLSAVETRQPNSYSKAPSYFDVNFVTLEGSGKYVGDGLTIYNTADAWWGEGDEKVYIDGETFPSFFGTGSEDYYGYAWCRPEVYIGHPFTSQPDGSGNITSGYSLNARYRSLDAIPFNKELKFDMELWHWAHCKVNYAPVTYWYLSPGGKCSIPKDIEGVKAIPAFSNVDINPPLLIEGKIEGENLQVLDKQGKVSTQSNIVKEWSNNAQLWWTEQKPGDKMTVQFIADHDYNGHLVIAFTQATDYGFHNISLNGKAIKNNLGFYNKQLQLRPFDLGNAEIKKGENTLTFECVSFSPQMKKAMLGIDCIQIKE